MKFRLHEIQDQGAVDLTGEIPAKDMPLESPDNPVLVSPVAVFLHAGADKEEVWADGTAEARVALTCARCLNSFETHVTGVLEISAPLTGTFLEVDDEVRQSLYLALPTQPLCRADCRGLCPRCGKNLNHGPCGCPPEAAPGPFDKLKKLIP